MAATCVKVWRDIQKSDQSETRTTVDKPLNQDAHIIETWFAEYNGNAVTATEAQWASASGVSIPTVGAYYVVGGQNYMLCTHVLAQRTQQSSAVFAVQVEYERQISVSESDPWDINISMSGKSFTQTVFVDRNGNQIANSAGQQFSNQPTKTWFDEQIDVSYKTKTPPDLSDYRGKVNSDSVSFTIGGISRSYDERQLLCVDGSMSTTVTMGDDPATPTPVWDVRISFASRADGYAVNILDSGMYQLDAGGQAPGGGNAGSASDSPPDGSGCTATAIVRIKDKFGNDVTSPVNLNGAGTPNGPCDAPVFLYFEIENETALSSLFDGLED